MTGAQVTCSAQVTPIFPNRFDITAFQFSSVDYIAGVELYFAKEGPIRTCTKKSG